MYHYVGRDDKSPPYGYYYLDIEDFRRQLDYFEANYDLLDEQTFFETIRGDRSPKKDEIVLTFDDGVKDHYEHVLPELVDRGLWGLFYVPAGPYLNNNVLDVHRTHSLLGAHGGAAVSEALTDAVTESMINEEHREQFSSVVYQSQDNQNDVERAKRILNYYISDRFRPNVLDTVEEQLFDAQLQREDVYLSKSNIKELVDAGMHVGAHSVTHTVMSKRSADGQHEELTESFDFLSDLLGGLPIRSYCHPYGGVHSYTEDTISLLKNAECLFSFDVASQPVTEDVLRNQRHQLPRYDCNEFRHGSATVSLG